MAEHGADMTGFTYDEESYADDDLDAWIVEVGDLLRAQREGGSKPKPTPQPAPEPTPDPDAATPAPKRRAKAKPKPKPKADG